MADIAILVDSSQVKTAKQDIQDLGNSFNSAAKSASVYMQTFAKAAAQSARDANYIRDVARANQEIINKNLKVSNSYNSAEASAAAFTEELRKQEAQAQKTARANQDAINSQLGVSGPSATSGGAGYGALEAEMLRLEAMYNKVAMAARVYEQAEESLNRAVLMGVITADQKEAKLGELSLAYQKVGNDADKAQAFIDRFGENAQVSGRGLNRFGMIAQQVGYQVGDFFVQIQSGTNFLVAFGQQATQLAGLIPGAWGAAIGIGISLATAIGAAFMRSGEAAEEASKGVDKYKEAIDSLNSAIKSTQSEIDKLTFGTEDAAISGARKAMQDAQAEVAALTASQRKVRGVAAPTAEEQAAIDKAVSTYRQLVIDLNTLIARQDALSEAQRMLNGGLSTAAGIQKGLVYDKQQELKAAKELVAATINAQQVYAKTRMEAAAAQAAIKEALSSKDAEQLNRAMEDALSAGLEFSKVDLSSIVALAARNGWSLAAAIQAAYAAAKAGPLVTADPSMGPGFERGGRLRGSSRQGTYQPTFSELLAEEAGKGGGGGDKTDPLEELRQQIKLETELLGVSEAQARVIQALGMDRSKYSEAEINAITAEIEAYNQKQEAIERTKQIMDTVKSSMEDAFMSMVDGTKSAKDAFKDMAAMIIKELYRVLVVQQLVGGIASAFGGGGGGLGLFTGPSTGSLGLPFGGTRATGGPIEAHKAYLVGEKGPELVIPRQSGTVVNAAQTAQAMGKGSGDITVQNNITVTGSDAAMVRTEIAKMIPQITNATKAAVIDAKQRGGQMAAAFR